MSLLTESALDRVKRAAWANPGLTGHQRKSAAFKEAGSPSNSYLENFLKASDPGLYAFLTQPWSGWERQEESQEYPEPEMMGPEPIPPHLLNPNAPNSPLPYPTPQMTEPSPIPPHLLNPLDSTLPLPAGMTGAEVEEAEAERIRKEEERIRKEEEAAARRRRRTRGGTLLTSGLGVLGAPQVRRRTLLGQ